MEPGKGEKQNRTLFWGMLVVSVAWYALLLLSTGALGWPEAAWARWLCVAACFVLCYPLGLLQSKRRGKPLTLKGYLRDTWSMYLLDLGVVVLTLIR